MLDRLSFIRSLALLIPLLNWWRPSPAQATAPGEALALNKEGEKYLEHAQYDRAFATFTKMLEASGDHLYAKGVATFYLGRCLLEMAEYSRAVDLLKEAEKIFKRLGKENEHAIVLQTLARLFSEKNQYAKGLKLFREAAVVFSRIKNKRELLLLFNNTAVVHAYMGHCQQSLECLLVAEKLADALQDPKHSAPLYNTTGLVHALTQQYKTARRACEQALGQFKQLGNTKGVAVALNNMGYIHECQSQYAHALQAHEESRRLAEKIGDPRNEAIALNNMGTVYLRKGEYYTAREKYEEALKISEKLELRQFMAETRNNLGLIDIALGRYASAMELFDRSYDLCKGLGSLNDQAWTLHNRGFLLKDQGDFKGSMKSFHAAIQLSLTSLNGRLGAAASLRLGTVGEYLGFFDDARKRFEKAEKMQSEFNDVYFRSDTLTHVADTLTRDGRFEAAKKTYEEAVDLRRKIGAPVGPALCKFALFLIEKTRYSSDSRRYSPGESRTDEEDKPSVRDLLVMAGQAIPETHVHDMMLLKFVKGKHVLLTDPKDAAGIFDRLKSDARTSGSGKFGFLASVGSGLSHEKSENRPAAQQAFRDAVSYLDTIRKTLNEKERAAFPQGEQILGTKNRDAYAGLDRVSKSSG